MSCRLFRPGHFGFFVTLENSRDFDVRITQSLRHVSSLQLKDVEGVDLGMNITAILFSSFRGQMYITEWQQIFRCGMFFNDLSLEMLRKNSKHVVKIIADTKQSDPTALRHFQVHCISGRSEGNAY